MWIMLSDVSDQGKRRSSDASCNISFEQKAESRVEMNDKIESNSKRLLPKTSIHTSLSKSEW